MCRKSSENWVKLDNVAYLKNGDKTYLSNVVTVYNVPYGFAKCSSYMENLEYCDIKERVNICISNGIIYYIVKRIKYCKFGCKTYRKTYAITPKGIF